MYEVTKGKVKDDIPEYITLEEALTLNKKSSQRKLQRIHKFSFCLYAFNASV